jgi:hypothetical protein
MPGKHLLPLLLASLFAASTTHAALDLIAIGSVSGGYEDFTIETAGPLENGVPGNRLGGIGSGLAYAGCNTFIALPDRGPNAAPYNSAVDNTTSYITRFQTLNLSLAPSDPDAALPFTLTPFLTATTLLWSRTPLSYGTGAGLGLDSGAPALNTQHIHYFTGRSDNFDPHVLSSTNPNNARLDPEGIRVSRDGKSVFISDEYGPYVYQFNRATGRRLKAFTLPSKFAVTNLSPVGATEISGNTSGRVANRGMEGLAITPDGKTLVGIMQGSLIQDGGTTVRIVTIDIATDTTHEYAYTLTTGSGVSEILAVNDHEFLVDERDGNGLGDNSAAAVKMLYKIDLTDAQDVSNLSGSANLAPVAVNKTEFLDVVKALTDHGIDVRHIPAKFEGLAFGQDVVINGVTKHTLYVVNDNDFTATTTVTVGGVAATVDNPNQIFVFAFDSTDLPGFVPQQIKAFSPLCSADREEKDDGERSNDHHR